MSTNSVKQGQFPVRGTFQPEISSRASGGQVSVRQTSEGDRGTMDHTGRGCVSPLGGATTPYTTTNKPGAQR
jgi:hypothetical protein